VSIADAALAAAVNAATLRGEEEPWGLGGSSTGLSTAVADRRVAQGGRAPAVAILRLVPFAALVESACGPGGCPKRKAPLVRAGQVQERFVTHPLAGKRVGIRTRAARKKGAPASNAARAPKFNRQTGQVCRKGVTAAVASEQSAPFDLRRRGAGVARLRLFNRVRTQSPGRVFGTASPPPRPGPYPPPYQAEVTAVVSTVCATCVLWSLGQTGAVPRMHLGSMSVDQAEADSNAAAR
jgi:hypothetical protein